MDVREQLGSVREAVALIGLDRAGRPIVSRSQWHRACQADCKMSLAVAVAAVEAAVPDERDVEARWTLLVSLVPESRRRRAS